LGKRERRRTPNIPHYIAQFAYTPEAWAGMAKNLENRSGPISQFLENLGGRLVSLYYCRGEYDGMVIFEAPDENTANAVSLAVVSSGQFRALRTTELFEVADVLESLRKMNTGGYQPPGQ
jgi:uncharacterized protein with GYD domain